LLIVGLNFFYGVKKRIINFCGILSQPLFILLCDRNQEENQRPSIKEVISRLNTILEDEDYYSDTDDEDEKEDDQEVNEQSEKFDVLDDVDDELDI
jgi:hypothetical protein